MGEYCSRTRPGGGFEVHREHPMSSTYAMVLMFAGALRSGPFTRLQSDWPLSPQ